MTEYLYTGVTSFPDLDKIHTDVAASDMDDKTIDGCRWDETLETLKVWWDGVLSTDDKAKLDVIVASSWTP